MQIVARSSATLLIGAVLAAAAFALEQPDGAAKPGMMKQMLNKNTAQAKLPAQVHDALAQLVGEFATVSEVHLAPPPAEPMVARADTSGRWVMGGLFVQVKSAAAEDEELKGERMIVYGYDPAAKKY